MRGQQRQQTFLVQQFKAVMFSANNHKCDRPDQQQFAFASGVKQEELSSDDYFSPPGVCDDAGCRRLLQNVGRIVPHSDVEMKRMQRNDVIRRIHALLQSQPNVNVYLFDDFLPAVDGGPATLFSEELLREFPVGRVRIWAPNLKLPIVEAQRRLDGPLGWLTAGFGCWHHFNARWEEEIHRAGGLDVVFADCFRGFERGCGALMADLVERRLVRRRTDARDERQCAVTFAVSDRYERTQGWSAAESALSIFLEFGKVFVRDHECPYAARILSHASYGVTMHYFVAVIHERQWAPRIAGFEARVEHWESKP
jgi:hypothetical protein